jgi:quinol monooxygenase YgiN
MIRHKVKNYAKWKPIFDSHSEKRKASGSRNYRILHSVDDVNNLVLLFEWDNLENARQFIQSEDLHKTMQEAGVLDQPDIYYLKEGEHKSE